ASQILLAALGTQWMIMFADGTQRLFPDGDAPSPDQIIIKNRSGSLANPGIGMDGSAAFYVPDVRSDVNFAFSVPPAPIYYAALFQNIELGEVIGSNVDVGPFELTFSEGADKVTLTAEEADGSIDVTLTYSTQPSLTLRSANRLNPAPGSRRWR
ncbi:MAG TPA: hypothetical protein VFV02_00075, partial [Acidimicrobiales bacterium]|nr:hypothetical protein [Acidimicrobiales bacterium]